MDESDEISRKQAAALLGVCERTLDLYRDRGLLEVKRQPNGRIMLSRRGCEQLREILLGNLHYVQACDASSYLIPPETFPRFPKRPYLTDRRLKQNTTNEGN
jgi:sulfite reductase beta subunit-like hemoprotein